MYTEQVQRMRVEYAVEGALSYASVLDMLRLWERLLRRARMPLAYSQGFSPHPRMQFAAALPVGYTSTCELLDLFLGERLAPLDLAKAIIRQSPPGLVIRTVAEVPLKADSPQATMRTAHYRVRLWTEVSRAAVEAAMATLLERPTIVRERQRKGRLADHDLRPLIEEIIYQATGEGYHELLMTLRTGSEGAGRPEEILDELALPLSAFTIQRERLVWGREKEGTA